MKTISLLTLFVILSLTACSAGARDDSWPPPEIVEDMDLYFPRLGYGKMTNEEQNKNLFRGGAQAVLSLADEPPLSSLGKEGMEVYRFIWVGAFRSHSPFAVRVQRNRFKRVTVATTVDDGEVGNTVTKRHELKRGEWAVLTQRLNAASYFELPIRVGQMKLDRGWWIVEGWRDGTYQYVEACSPGPGPYRALCEFFMGLGGFDPKVYERH